MLTRDDKIGAPGQIANPRQSAPVVDDVSCAGISETSWVSIRCADEDVVKAISIDISARDSSA
jgi:hypothetical protein